MQTVDRLTPLLFSPPELFAGKWLVGGRVAVKTARRPLEPRARLRWQVHDAALCQQHGASAGDFDLYALPSG